MISEVGDGNPSGMSLVILVEDAKFWLLRLSTWLGVSTETATSLGSLPSTSPSKRRSMSGMTSSCTSQNVREPGETQEGLNFLDSHRQNVKPGVPAGLAGYHNSDKSPVILGSINFWVKLG